MRDPRQEEANHQGGTDGRGSGVGPVPRDEPVGLDVGVLSVDEVVEDPANDPNHRVGDPGDKPADDELEARRRHVAHEPGNLVDGPADRASPSEDGGRRRHEKSPHASLVNPSRASSSGSGSHG